MDGLQQKLVDELKQLMTDNANELEDYIINAEQLNVTNEQWFIDILDRINELSVKH